jgi:hypothetical protein
VADQTKERGHISDQDLLLFVDAELDLERAHNVEAHLAKCEVCSARLQTLEQTLSEFSVAYRKNSVDSPTEEPLARVRLLGQMAETKVSPGGIRRWAPSVYALANRRWAFNAAVIAIAILGVALVYQQFWLTNSGDSIASVQAAPLPLPNLTPGAVADVPGGICLAAPREDASRIPVAERKEVFREYGMDYRHAGQYELDHLITPALGGTDDIHNLWPEPYNSQWNAHVKDQLEDLLHQMVCSGQIDLPTAQRAIATNWIEAYKHYFNTEKPLASYSASDDEDDRATAGS